MEQIGYLSSLSRDIKQQVDSMAKRGISPLTKAIAEGLYTQEEVSEFYGQFLAKHTLDIPGTWNECDSAMPWTCVTIVTIQGLLVASGPNTLKRYALLHDMVSMAVGAETKLVDEDVQTGLALAANHMFAYGDRGLNQMMALHAATMHVLHRAQDQGQTSLGISMAAKFFMRIYFTAIGRPLVPMVDQYIALFAREEGFDSHAGIVTAAGPAFQQLRQATSGAQLKEIHENAAQALSSMYTCSAPLHFVLAQIKLAITTFMQLAVLEPESSDRQAFLKQLATTSMNQALRMTAIFADSRDSLTGDQFICVADMLVVMTGLRMATFAVRLDVDINLDLLSATVATVWTAVVQSNYHARQLYLAYVQARDIGNVKIGMYNQIEDKVGGPGDMEDFALYSHGRLVKNVTAIYLSREWMMSNLVEMVKDVFNTPRYRVLAPASVTHHFITGDLSADSAGRRFHLTLQYL